MSLIIAVTGRGCSNLVKKSFFSALLGNLGVTVDDLLSGAPAHLRRQDGTGLGASLKYVPYSVQLQNVEVLTWSKYLSPANSSITSVIQLTSCWLDISEASAMCPRPAVFRPEPPIKSSYHVRQ
jgi:hypothetical protein